MNHGPWQFLAVVAVMMIGREIDRREPADLLIHLDRIMAREMVDANLIRIALQLAQEEAEALRLAQEEEEAARPGPGPASVEQPPPPVPMALPPLPPFPAAPPPPPSPPEPPPPPVADCRPELRALSLCP